MGRERRAGLLLHPTSLPGRWGLGDLGPGAVELLDWLAEAGLRIWQVLPLNPVDDHGCPYASSSAFAREPLLLSLDALVQDGWLRETELPAPLPEGAVHYPTVAARKRRALERAADRVVAAGHVPDDDWVATWALFEALRARHGPAWIQWPAALRDSEAAALAEAREALAPTVARAAALQWLVAQQWGRLREAARARDIEIWGDVPFFIGHGSCDVWADRDLFRLDDTGLPTVVTGVPPDAFSPVGQRWGHPHYDPAVHVRTGHAWWIARLGLLRQDFDVVRLDHFRGLAGVWEIPVEAPDATTGAWVPGMGAPFLEALRAAHPDLRLIAEDLGVITDDVRALKEAFGLPGMAVLQFAFGGEPNHAYLPHQHVAHQVVYTGTHDNDTLRGWWAAADGEVRGFARRYLTAADDAVPDAVIRAAWRSPCAQAIVPAQDLLGLGSEARLNTPGVAAGNWRWRMAPGALTVDLARRVREQVEVSGRGAAPARRHHPPPAGGGEAEGRGGGGKPPPSRE